MIYFQKIFEYMMKQYANNTNGSQYNLQEAVVPGFHVCQVCAKRNK